MSSPAQALSLRETPRSRPFQASQSVLTLRQVRLPFALANEDQKFEAEGPVQGHSVDVASARHVFGRAWRIEAVKEHVVGRLAERLLDSAREASNGGEPPLSGPG